MVWRTGVMGVSKGEKRGEERGTEVGCRGDHVGYHFVRSDPLDYLLDWLPLHTFPVPCISAARVFFAVPQRGLEPPISSLLICVPLANVGREKQTPENVRGRKQRQTNRPWYRYPSEGLHDIQFGDDKSHEETKAPTRNHLSKTESDPYGQQDTTRSGKGNSRVKRWTGKWDHVSRERESTGWVQRASDP